MEDANNPLYGITIKEIARICHVDLTTARRWKRGTRCPPKMALLLIAGDLGCFDPAFKGWVIRHGKLISRDGWEISEPEVMGVRLMRLRFAAFEAEIRRLKEVVHLTQEQPLPEAFPEWVFEMRA